MDKHRVMDMVQRMSILLELKGANPFKVRAWKNAHQTLEKTEEDFNTLYQEGSLTKLKGIGKGIAEAITVFLEKGSFEEFDELKKIFPDTIFELFRIPKLGPKKIKVLFEKLGVDSISSLEYACQENRLLKLDGFGEKTQTHILKGIAFLKQNMGHFRYKDAFMQAQVILEDLTKSKHVQKLSMAGSLRRKNEIVKSIDLICASDDPTSVINFLGEMAYVDAVIEAGPVKTCVVLASGIQVDLKVVRDQDFAAALHHFTGSEAHHVQLRRLAQKNGFEINQRGVFKGEEKINIDSEAELYQKLAIDFIAPEMREGMGEIELAANQSLPNLVELQDIKGVFHMHTTYSDGKHTLEDMVKTCVELKLEYVGVSDHSQTAVYAHGLTAQDIKKQHKEIDVLQKKYPMIRIFKGIESDILKDGALDYSKDVLKDFDFVIASVHSGFAMDESEMTQRCKRALEHPATTMLGHPTGRILLGREPFPIDMHAIIDHAVSLNKIVELNASPYRLDIDWRLLPYLRNKDGMVSINPDAHSMEALSNLEYGVNMARKGGLSASHVLNTRSVAQMEQFLEI